MEIEIRRPIGIDISRKYEGDFPRYEVIGIQGDSMSKTRMDIKISRENDSVLVRMYEPYNRMSEQKMEFIQKDNPVAEFFKSIAIGIHESRGQMTDELSTDVDNDEIEDGRKKLKNGIEVEHYNKGEVKYLLKGLKGKSGIASDPTLNILVNRDGDVTLSMHEWNASHSELLLNISMEFKKKGRLPIVASKLDELTRYFAKS